MTTQTRRRTWTAAFAVSALVAGLLAAASQPADAAVLGKLNLTPASGNTASILDIETLVPCAEGAAFVAVELRGAGIDPDTGGNILTGLTDIGPGNTPVNDFGGYSVAVGAKFFDVFQFYNITAPSGDYTLAVNCYDSNAVYTDEITGTVRFTASGGSFNATYVQLSNADPTSTTLGAGPADPVLLGASVTLTATVTTDVPGTVQFKRNGANLGAAAAVAGGVASLVTTALPAGTNSLTATFTPTEVTEHAPSTSSAVSFVVAGPSAITGTTRVGGKITCSSTSGATRTFSWKVGTTTSAVTSGIITSVPSSWLGKSVTCTTKTVKGETQVSQTSPAKTITKGVAPVATTKPKVLGTALVGKTLTCSKGTWTPTPTSYKYNWYRGTTLLSGKVYSTYKTVSLDKGKYISCKVTALKTGHLTGTAKSPGRKIS